MVLPYNVAILIKKKEQANCNDMNEPQKHLAK